MKTEYYVEVVDKRVDLDPPYVWQSESFATKEEALKLGRKVAASFRRSDLSYLLQKNPYAYLNPAWEVSAKGVKSNLQTRLMIIDWINEDEYEIGFLKNIRG